MSESIKIFWRYHSGDKEQFEALCLRCEEDERDVFILEAMPERYFTHIPRKDDAAAEFARRYELLGFPDIGRFYSWGQWSKNWKREWTNRTVRKMAMHAIPESIVIEARAKIIWGDGAEKVMGFLQAKNIGDKDALALIEELMTERAGSIRADGMKKTWVGALFVLAPVAYYFASMLIGYWSLKFFAVLIVLGAVGVAKITNGLSMILRPRAVTGDLANGGN